MAEAYQWLKANLQVLVATFKALHGWSVRDNAPGEAEIDPEEADSVLRDEYANCSVINRS